MKAAQGEYRRHERTGLKLPVDIEIEGQHVDASMLNVSMSGLALTRDQALSLQKNQVVKVQFPGLPTLAAEARVVYIGPEHVGLSLYHARFSDTDIDSLVSIAPYWERFKVYAKRALWTQTRRLAVLAVNTLLRPLLLSAVKPKFLFAAYGTRRDVDTYFTPWMEKILPPVIICGFIRNEKKRGFMVASKYLESELLEESEKVKSYLRNLQIEYPGMERIALVGRLPNFVLKAGLPIEAPFVSGAMGTRYMIWDAARQMKELPAYVGERGITVLGGAGRIGNLVCEDLTQLYDTVIAFDKRYENEETIQTPTGTIIRTSLPWRLAENKLFIGLTHHGDVIKEWTGSLPRGSLIADDTHPCISLDVREYLAEHQINTLKIVLGNADFSMKPRMPAWNNRDIPGCLVEALVLLDNEEEVANDFHRFSEAARKAGFQGRLIEPLDE